MNFFTRRSPLSSAQKSPSIDSPENNKPTTSPPKNDQHETESLQRADSAYVSTVSPAKQSSQIKRYGQRAPSTLSSSSFVSDVLNHDLVLNDENCSLKSDDLICDYDDTLTLNSTSKNDKTDSCSTTSVTSETNQKPTMITTVTTTKPTFSPFQFISRDHRTAPPFTTSLSVDRTNSNLQESLDELTELSHRMDNTTDHEHHRRLLTRSVSLKPPLTSLPLREDAEQITMDIESYRQAMKDVMVANTIFHQLDRLLKHSDGANLTVLS